MGEAIRALRIGRARSARAYLYEPGACAGIPSSGAGLNIEVVLGVGRGFVADGEMPRSGSDVGDVVFVPRIISHALADSPTTPAVDVPVDEEDFWFGQWHPARAAPRPLGDGSDRRVLLPRS